jgi:hypothetical protein
MLNVVEVASGLPFGTTFSCESLTCYYTAIAVIPTDSDRNLSQLNIAEYPHQV